MEKIIEKCKKYKNTRSNWSNMFNIRYVFYHIYLFHYFGYTSSIKLCNFWQGNTILFLAILNLLFICKRFYRRKKYQISLTMNLEKK